MLALHKSKPSSTHDVDSANSICSRMVRIRSSQWYITTMVVNAIFVDIFLYCVMVAVFPYSLVTRNHIKKDQVQKWMDIIWAIESVGLLVTAPLCGIYSDRFANRKRPLIFGFGLLVSSNIALCAGKNVPLLIVGRFFQGIATAICWVVGLATLAESVDTHKVGKYLGLAAEASSVASILGPIFGGVLYEKSGYLAVFGLCFALLAIDGLLKISFIEKRDANRDTNHGHELNGQSLKEKDLAQSPQSLQSERPGLLPFTRHDSIDTSSTTGSGSDSHSEPLKENTVQESRRLPALLILLKLRRTQTVFLANAVCSMGFTAFDVTLPLFVKDKFGWESLGSGVIFLAFLSPCAGQYWFGKLVDRIGPKWPAVAGQLITVTPWICLRFVTNNTIQHQILLCVLLFLIGLGTHITLSATMTEFTLVATDQERKSPGSMGNNGAYGQSYAIFIVSWAIGSLSGSFMAGELRERAGWAVMGLTYAALYLIVSIPTLVWCGGFIGNYRRRESPTEDSEAPRETNLGG